VELMDEVIEKEGDVAKLYLNELFKLADQLKQSDGTEPEEYVRSQEAFESVQK
jgi:hypothetical protein